MENHDRSMTNLEQKQATLCNMVKMIARSQYHALFVVSAAGVGKSYCITRTLEEEGQDVILLNSHATTLQTYRILFENRDNDAVLFFDDCDSLYRSASALGILRSALYGQPNRIVTYNSSQLPDDLPTRFETTARFIFCANQIPKKNPMFDAVLSRCLVYRMELTNSEIIEQFRVMSQEGYPGCPSDAAAEIVDFIEEQGSEKQLSMRLLTPAIRIYKFCNEQNTDWRPVLLAQLQNLGRPAAATKRVHSQEKDLRVLKSALWKFPDQTAEQCRYFMDKTGKSRASFYRVLARFKEQANSDTR